MSQGGNRSDQHSALVKFVMDYIELQGGWRMKVWGGPFQRTGIPDVIGVIGGRGISVEVKTGKAVLDDAQEKERKDLEAAGALYVLCRTPEDLMAAVEGAGLAIRARMRFGG